jgi:cytochrome c-type biogenesis protein CcmH/NrfG
MEDQTYRPRVRVVSEMSPRTVNANATKERTFPEEKKPKAVFNILDRVVAICIFMLFLGLPIFFTGLTLQGIVFEKQIYFYFWTLLALISWAGKGVMTGEMKIRRTPLDIPIALFWLTYLLSSIVSVDRWHSFFGLFGDPSRGLMNVTALIIIYYLIMSNFSLRLFRWLLGGILASTFIIMAWSALGVFGLHLLPARFSSLIPLSLIGSVSGLGMFLSIALPLIIMSIFKLQDGLSGKMMKKILTAIFLSGMILDIVLLLVLFGFVPWIGLMIGFGVFLIFILSRIVRPDEKWTWVASGTFIALMAIMMSGSNFHLAKTDLPVEVGPSYGLSYQIAKESLKNNFVLGTGVASYGYDFSLHKPEIFNQNQLYNLRFYQATGIVFEAISSVGILGTLALLLLLLSFISVCAYLLVVKKEKDKVYSLGFATASFIFLISAVLVRTEGTLVIFGTLILALTLAIVIRESESEENYFNISLKTSPKYALTLAFIFMVISAGVVYLFVFVGKMYAADIYAGKSVRQASSDGKKSVEMMDKAIGLNSKESRYHINTGQNYMVLANDEMLKSGIDRDIQAVQGYLNQSVAAAVAGRDLSPNDVSAVEALAQIYENAGVYVADSLKLAGDAYSRGLELEPSNPNFILGLGKVKLSQAVVAKGDDEKKQLINEAKDLFQKSIDVKDNFAPGYYQLAIAKGALGDFDGAIDAMGKAAALDNSNINYFFNLGRLYQQRAMGDDEKIAETIFKKILGANDNEVNTHFSLATLYEKEGEKDKALAEYGKVLTLVPDENSDVRDKVEKMIENLKNGISNLEDGAKTDQ